MAGSIATTTIAHKERGLVRIDSVLTTDAAGVVTAGVVGAAYGRLVAVAYKPNTLATGADITVKDQKSGATIFSLTDAGTSARYIRPTGVVTTNAGVAITAAATATAVDRDIYVAGKVTVEVAQGGNTLNGTLSLIFDESLGGGF
jgi:hypothetical protein